MHKHSGSQWGAFTTNLGGVSGTYELRIHVRNHEAKNASDSRPRYMQKIVANIVRFWSTLIEQFTLTTHTELRAAYTHAHSCKGWGVIIWGSMRTYALRIHAQNNEEKAPSNDSEVDVNKIRKHC